MSRSQLSLSRSPVKQKFQVPKLEPEVDIQIDLDDHLDKRGVYNKPESLFESMGETKSQGSADTRDEKQNPKLENMEIFSVSKQQVAKNLVTSLLGTLFRFATGDVSGCCNLPPSYADKLGAKQT